MGLVKAVERILNLLAGCRATGIQRRVLQLGYQRMQLIEKTQPLAEYFLRGDVLVQQHTVGDRRLTVLVVAGGLIFARGCVEGHRRGVALGAGQQIAAFFVAHVEEAHQGLFDTGHFTGDGGDILVGIGTIGRPEHQVLQVEHGVRHRLQVGFLNRQAGGQRTHVRAVLRQARLFTLQAQQPHTGNRVIRRLSDAIAGGHLLHQLAQLGCVGIHGAMHHGGGLGISNAHDPSTPLLRLKRIDQNAASRSANS